MKTLGYFSVGLLVSLLLLVTLPVWVLPILMYIIIELFVSIGKTLTKEFGRGER